MRCRTQRWPGRTACGPRQSADPSASRQATCLLSNALLAAFLRSRAGRGDDEAPLVLEQDLMR